MPITAFTRGGTEYTPLYLSAIDSTTCIGCGRCFKVCSRSVMTLKGVTEDGDLVDLIFECPLVERANKADHQFSAQKSRTVQHVRQFLR
ncbi:hypothetical protein EOM89_10540 [Candidatus Falkowbacteria bacterium]|nr:hypothetical protein [Candidatus Falkowbacteria bacterium]